MARGLVYFLVVLLSALPARSVKACSLKGYKYCELAIGKKCLLDSPSVKKDCQSEVPKFKRKYKTKGIQVIIPALPFLPKQEFVYRNAFVPHLSVWEKTTSDVRANCKRGPPLT